MSATFKGTKVQEGDTVKASLEGVVKATGSGEILVDVPGYGRTWVGESKFSKLEVTKKAGPDEPGARDAVVEVETNWGDKSRLVKRGSKWSYIDPFTTSPNLTIQLTWDEIVGGYDKVTVLEANTKPKLPAEHKVRDLTTMQRYERISGCGTLGFKKTLTGLEMGVQYTLKPEEAVALAWDILKAYGKVQ